MAERKEWSGDERRKILERRKKDRASGQDSRKPDRRISQVCYVCHGGFTPKVSGEIICEKCTLEGTRSGRKGDRERPPF